MDNKKLRVYISGAISNNPDFKLQFGLAEAKLKSQGFDVVNPAKMNDAMPESSTWGEYMDITLNLLKICDIIYMLDGWEELQEPVWNWQDINYRVKPELKRRPYTKEEIMKAVAETLYYDYNWSPVEIGQFRECVIERLKK